MMKALGSRNRLSLAVLLAAATLLSGFAAAPAVAATTHVSAASTDAPGTTTKTITKKVSIPFTTVTQSSASLSKGTRKTSVKGVTGVRTKVIEVTYRDGKVAKKKVLTSTITRKPVTKVVLVGTKVSTSSKCDPNYSGECVPIASDVDCAGGSGNGPGYVYGTVRVIGSDIYDLDRDGDGYGCD